MKTAPTIDQQRKQSSERNAAQESDQARNKDQGIRKDQRGQEQPADTERAQKNR